MEPKKYGYSMPAEWTEHERTLISWPVKESMQHPEDYDGVCKGYAQVVRAVAEFEPVTLLINPGESEALRKYVFPENVELLAVPHDDAWLRDNGPTFLLDGAGNRAAVSWRFNAWGGKYPEWERDDAVTSQILMHFGVRGFNAPLIMEGGSFHTDGEGTLITTGQCLLNPNRNPNLSKAEIEAYLKQYLNINKIIWLKRGLSGDETDGHVDNVACFAAPGKILMQICDDPADENYGITQENLETLSEAVDAKGRELEVIPIMQPPAAYVREGRLTLSYLNFYIANGGIILPVFGGCAQATDEMAVETLKHVFADKEIRTVDGMAIVKEGGNVHCITQQMAKGAQGRSVEKRDQQ